MVNKNKEQHWYCFSFSGAANGVGASASQYLGLETKQIKKMFINYASELTGLDKGAVLISATYLGLMTNEQFTAKETINGS